MNVVVCVKQIPDPAAPPALEPGTNTLDRSGKLILDDSDAYGVEMALQLVDAAGGRCRGVHFGVYDYLSSLGILAGDGHAARQAAARCAMGLGHSTLEGLVAKWL